jgi:pimeloyl-ACP methyl ester carboxylesterase
MVFCLVAALGVLTWSQAANPVRAEPPKPPPGVVIIVGGVGGIDVLGTAAQWALPRAGVHHEVVDFFWSHGRGHIFKDLQDTRHCLRKADELATAIWNLKLFEPERPVYLVGKSGGTGLVLAAAEQLPPGMIERIILLSAAVAPTYDLRPALRATKHELVSFYSPFDQFVLGWGTSHFGTIDRYYGPSAGLRGFIVPTNLSTDDRALYDRLVQLRWHPGMIKEGHLGGHIGNSLPGFVANELAPWLKP